ncbi:MAG: hypothetical protein RSB70_03655 [Clostridium sp.]
MGKNIQYILSVETIEGVHIQIDFDYIKVTEHSIIFCVAMDKANAGSENREIFRILRKYEKIVCTSKKCAYGRHSNSKYIFFRVCKIKSNES